MAKSTSVDATQLMDQKADSEEVDALRERLAELEEEITALRAKSADDLSTDETSELKLAYEHAIQTIDTLMSEKDEIEQKLLAHLEKQDEKHEKQISMQQKRLDSQQAQIELLIKEIQDLKASD